MEMVISKIRLLGSPISSVFYENNGEIVHTTASNELIRGIVIAKAINIISPGKAFVSAELTNEGIVWKVKFSTSINIDV